MSVRENVLTLVRQDNSRQLPSKSITATVWTIPSPVGQVRDGVHVRYVVIDNCEAVIPGSLTTGHTSRTRAIIGTSVSADVVILTS